MNSWYALEIKRYIFIILVVLLFIFSIETNPARALSENDMQNPTILTNEGWKSLRQGISQNPNNREEFFKKSEIFFQKAEDYFKKAIAIDKYQADAYAGLGQLIIVRKHLPFPAIPFDKDSCAKAIKFFDIAISLDKKTRAVTNKTEALLCLEDFDAALSEADMAEKNNGCFAHSLKARAYKGRFLKKHDSLDKKMAIIEATDYMECDSYGLNLLRDVLRTTKDFDLTEKYLKHDVELKPYERMPYHFYYEFLLLRTDEGYMKDTDIPEFERIIKQGKANTGFDIGFMEEVQLHRAEAFIKKKEYDRAFTEYTECLIKAHYLGYGRSGMRSLCLKFTDDRCVNSWKKIIRADLERGDCANASEDLKPLYAAHPTEFEEMKEVVNKCKDKKGRM